MRREAPLRSQNACSPAFAPSLSNAQGQPHAFVTDLAAIQAGGAPAEAWAAFLAFLRANALLPARPPMATSW